ncbi:MAG TPA: hypothetical protein VJH22_01800 [Candidatus Nanoarchaeia archaeon]|nr:hypothetical protein [Candidatus Nanoarchaeia archaeon]
MILLDTHILITFSLADKIDLLIDLVVGHRLGISSNVLAEIKKGQEKAYPHAALSIKYVLQSKIEVLIATTDETRFIQELPSSFGRGEQDSVSIAKHRKGIFLTNEKRIINYCERERISCITLEMILRSLWEEGIQTKEQVKRLIDDIEQRDNLVISSKEEIFSE